MRGLDQPKMVLDFTSTRLYDGSSPKQTLNAGDVDVVSEIGDEMLDSGDYILITVKTAIHRCGSFYTKVWGSTFEVEFGGKTFIQIGGFGDDVLVSPDDIVNAVPWHIAPTDPNVLVLTNEHDGLLEGIGLDTGIMGDEVACLA